MFHVDFSFIQLRLAQDGGQRKVFDPIRKKWFVLTPEEHVRQYLLAYMLTYLSYPAPLMAVEKAIKVGEMVKRFDIVVYSRQHEPWMLIECKAPEVPISEKTLYQLLQYQHTVQGHFWLLSNGRECFCADARDVANISWLPSFPDYGI